MASASIRWQAENESWAGNIKPIIPYFFRIPLGRPKVKNRLAIERQFNTGRATANWNTAFNGLLTRYTIAQHF
jgi:hypothetical protein